MKCPVCKREIKELVKVEILRVERRSIVRLENNTLVSNKQHEKSEVTDYWYKCPCGALITDDDSVARAILEGRSNEEVMKLFEKIMLLKEASR